jgi:hypothetical protein
MITRYTLLALLLAPLCCFAQYKGGQDDGASIKAAPNQNALPALYFGGDSAGYVMGIAPGQNLLPGIYTGGADDGVAILARTLQNPGADIYKGGAQDGFAVLGITQQNTTGNIYKGGADDGVSVIASRGINVAPSIYTGGDSDGVDNVLVLNSNPLPGIYAGGVDDGYSIFIKNVANPLPSKPAGLLQFTGRWYGNDALLEWTTNEGPGIDHFELERSDDGGKTFTKVAATPADDKRNGQRNYTNTDIAAYVLPADALLYRLKSIRKDGSAAYSGIARLTKDKTAPVLVVYPNPTSGQFTLSVSNLRQGYKGYKYIVSAVNGAVMQQGDITDAHTAFNLSGKASGTYFLAVLRDGKLIQNFTIIIAH